MSRESRLASVPCSAIAPNRKIRWGAHPFLAEAQIAACDESRAQVMAARRAGSFQILATVRSPHSVISILWRRNDIYYVLGRRAYAVYGDKVSRLLIMF